MRGFVERLVADETAGQRPLAFKRVDAALDQQHFQILVVESEDDAVDGEGRERRVAAVPPVARLLDRLVGLGGRVGRAHDFIVGGTAA